MGIEKTVLNVTLRFVNAHVRIAHAKEKIWRTLEYHTSNIKGNKECTIRVLKKRMVSIEINCSWRVCVHSINTWAFTFFANTRTCEEKRAHTCNFIVVECFAWKRGNAAQEFWDRLLTGVLVEHHDI